MQAGMQPSKPLSVAINGDGGVSITAARAAWLRGDFEACLQHLGALSNCGENPEALLLYARALLRTERAAEVVRVLGDSFAMFEDRDESCTAQMLYASAVARSDPARGLALLAEVSTNAEAKSAHRTIRAEIEYYRGLALWQTGDLEGATRHVLIAERAHADVISVRATQLRGFIAIARCEYAAALKLFREALSAYHECREHDGDVAARIELQI
ncbi:MAG: hypothetical protein JOZ58_27150, partial [Acetobacteraceae bacterium]|nr:hypothetical protein [Acetobacteraceae bacterium]